MFHGKNGGGAHNIPKQGEITGSVHLVLDMIYSRNSIVKLFRREESSKS